MPPKAKFTKEEIIAAALAVVEKQGIQHLTARSVAKCLGSSTAPVYQLFSSMKELELEVIKLTQSMMMDYTSKKYSEKVFLNMGVGIAMFAKEHQQLYKALHLESNNYSDLISEYLKTLESLLKTDSRFVELSSAERRKLLHKMWTFTHGLASMICVGHVKNCSQKYITETLMDVGSDVIGATLAKSARQNADNQKNK